MTARLAIVDPGSFVLPYDYQLAEALAGRGDGVDFYGSRTGYNGGFLDAMRRLPGVRVLDAAISSTVAPRWLGAIAYLALLLRLLLRSGRYRRVNLQFSAWWPAEWLVFALLRRKFVFTVHNAVPHGHAGRRHAPTQRLAALARSLVFISEATREDFMQRYGESFRARSALLPIGLLPVAPGLPPTPYAPAKPPRALIFWSTVKPYKGVELFAELARSEAVRRRGLALEVCGAWARELHPLREELRALGVQVTDRYLDEAQLLQLLARDAVFLLPYQHASQSGALYSLLNHGCTFVCSDTGDLGAFMRTHGLQGLLLAERSADAVLACLDHLQAHGPQVAAALHEAQQRLRWDRLLAEAGDAYGTGR